MIFINTEYYNAHLPDSHHFIFYSPILHLNEFLVGNLIGLIYLKFNNILPPKLDYSILFTFIAIIAIMLFDLSPTFHNGLFAILFAPLILLISYNRDGFISRLLQNRVLVLLGEASYGLYILQVPIFRFCKYLFRKLNIVDVSLIFYLSLAVLIISSLVSYVFVERPLRILIKNIGSGLGLSNSR